MIAHRDSTHWSEGNVRIGSADNADNVKESAIFQYAKKLHVRRVLAHLLIFVPSTHDSCSC